MLSFRPQTEREVLNLLDAGIYDFYVKKSELAYSQKTRNPMIKLTIAVIGDLGREHVLTDYLMESMMYKMKHFCDAVGLEKEYESGNLLAEMCDGKSGKVKIFIDDPGDNSAFNPKNAVKDYVRAVKEMPTKDNDFIDSDIPDFK
jgi:hypothetical protein